MIDNKLESHKTYIINEYNNGKSMAKLGKEFNCNSGTIFFFLKKHNVSTRKKKRQFTGPISQFDDQIIELYNDGDSCGQISKKLGPSIHTICRRMKILNLDSSRYSVVDHENLLKDMWPEIEKMFLAGKSCRQISKDIGKSDSEVWRLVKKHGYTPTRNIYTVDESFFEQIDTQEKAYVLGFLFADGNVRNDCFRGGIQEKDKDILVKISQVLGYNGPIGLSKKRNPKHQNLSILNITRTKMAQDLINLGCPPAKSLILKFPVESLPEHLYSHFIRGYFDGDGSLSRTVTLTGSYEFITYLPNILPCTITNIHARFKDKDPKLTAHTLKIDRKEECYKFLNWIYKDSTIHLDRKYYLYLDFVKKHEEYV